MYTHVLVPLDGSERAERALPVAERIARASKGRITLLQAVNMPLPVGAPYDTAALSASSIEQCEAEATAYLTRIAGWPLLSGLQVETVVATGAPALVILDIAAEKGADLTVLCGHGRTGASRWVLGSVAEHVARQSPVPVFVLRAQGPTPAHPHPDPDQPLHVLVPLDGSPFAEAALAPAAEMTLALAGTAAVEGLRHGALAERAAMHLSLVLPPYDLDRENLPDTLALDGARTYLRRTADHLRDTYPRLQVTWSVASGLDVADALLRVAETGEDTEGAGPASRCDLIAMATHGRSGISRWTLGSITERVLHGTKLPLLIVRPAAFVKQISTGTRTADVVAPETTTYDPAHDRGAVGMPWQALF
ncbi:MAG TPA: universal stress protein [Ktedonobacterales bacterium]